MPISLYRASVPVFVRGFGVLSALLDKAAAHAAENRVDPLTLIDARLAPDMKTLAEQVQHASDTAKFSVARLSGVASPRMEDTERSFPELQKRIAKTVAYMTGIDAAQIDGGEARQIELSWGDFRPSFSGEDYLFAFGLPNFYFHIVTAHGILRHKGVSIGKLDYLGPYEA